MKAYKGFDKNLKCRDFQYEIGKTYEHEGPVKVCESGFHSCENPLDVWAYYPITKSKFCMVNADGEIQRHGEDSKIVSASITIIAEIGLPEIIKDAVAFIFSLVKASKETTATTGYKAHAATTGEGAVAAALGDSSKAKAGATGAIVLVHRDIGGKILAIRASKVGENGIKPDTWYSLNAAGEFVEE